MLNSARFFKQEIVQRFVFGIALVAIFTLAVGWGYSFLMYWLVVLSVLALSFEYCALLARRKIFLSWFGLVGIAAVFFILPNFSFTLNWLLLIAGALLGVGIVVCFGVGYFFKKYRIKSIFYFLYLIWILAPVFLFFLITYFPKGQNYLIFLVLVVVTTDIMAYFGGKNLGKRKLAPKISPNKTVAGLVCGLLGAVAFGIGYNYFWPIFTMREVFFVAFFVSFAGQVGDLLESYFKRLAGAKNSGAIIPGHGGAMDRFDGLLVATWVFFSYLYVGYWG